MCVITVDAFRRRVVFTLQKVGGYVELRAHSFHEEGVHKLGAVLRRSAYFRRVTNYS